MPISFSRSIVRNQIIRPNLIPEPKPMLTTRLRQLLVPFIPRHDVLSHRVLARSLQHRNLRIREMTRVNLRSTQSNKVPFQTRLQDLLDLLGMESTQVDAWDSGEAISNFGEATHEGQSQGNLSLGENFSGVLLAAIGACGGAVSRGEGRAESVDGTDEIMVLFGVGKSGSWFAEVEEDAICTTLQGIAVVDDIDDIVIEGLVLESQGRIIDDGTGAGVEFVDVVTELGRKFWRRFAGGHVSQVIIIVI